MESCYDFPSVLVGCIKGDLCTLSLISLFFSTANLRPLESSGRILAGFWLYLNEERIQIKLKVVLFCVSTSNIKSGVALTQASVAGENRWRPLGRLRQSRLTS